MTVGWTWYERNNVSRRVPKPQQGNGYFEPKTPEEDKNFDLDESSGLLLPATAAKTRRKVKIGFQPKDEQ